MDGSLVYYKGIGVYQFSSPVTQAQAVRLYAVQIRHVDIDVHNKYCYPSQTTLRQRQTAARITTYAYA